MAAGREIAVARSPGHSGGASDRKDRPGQAHGSNVMGYIFDPEHLHCVARTHAGLPHEDMTAAIIGDLAKAYPRHIETRQNWLLSIAGGAMGIMTILHGSLS